MMNEKRIKAMGFIKEWSEEWEMTIKEAVYTLVFSFYEVSGFRADKLEKELDAKSEEELIEIFCEILSH